MIEAPIPGQSLTTAPNNNLYERPPEISDPEEALQMHLNRLNDPEKLEDILDVLELDVSIRELTEGILRSAVAEGLHSIDVSMIIAPVVHEFITSVADEAGIEYDDGLVDKAKEEKGRNSVVAAKARKINLEKKPEVTPAVAPVSSPVSVETEEPQGFVVRRS